ncbi:hypothetical protein CY34DRAFT_808575 [Suillus luteus UH-Slu-Lm8-n1]|uniref:Uncharacterized protein n=1 Tax=Suillus luteus UH-Slu-Lm8-n1 TaxID=930992 RepID=A0A0D0ABL2_9AGAM|nr:hypothetical protein CY34DRAFT_808575 [Suillus luteus UH-Slu-Lm8-n1]
MYSCLILAEGRMNVATVSASSRMHAHTQIYQYGTNISIMLMHDVMSKVPVEWSVR